MSSKHIGICALCGKEKELTFEHLPPNKAFNFTPAKPVNGEDFFTLQMTKIAFLGICQG